MSHFVDGTGVLGWFGATRDGVPTTRDDRQVAGCDDDEPRGRWQADTMEVKAGMRECDVRDYTRMIPDDQDMRRAIQRTMRDVMVELL